MERRSISQFLDAPEGVRHAPPFHHHRPPRHDASRQMNAAATFSDNEFMAVGGAAYPI
ncbi:hypothetical protein WJX84_005390, partial [Apatococcus fuscideae]